MIPTHALSMTSHYLSSGETFKQNDSGAIYRCNEQVEITLKGKIENANSSSQWNRSRIGSRRSLRPGMNCLSYFQDQKRKAKDERCSGGI